MRAWGEPGMATIPSNVVNTDHVAPRERFDLWRAVLSATHEAQLPDGSDPAAFRAFARGWYLGHSLVIETRVTAQHLSRLPRTIRADQYDHYIVRLQRQGRWTGEVDDRTVEAGCGSVTVLDMARTSTASVTDIENINVILPRDALDDVLPPFDMHGLVLQGAMGTLLRSHLVSLVLNLPRMQAADAGHVAGATLNLMAACLAPSRAPPRRSGSRGSRRFAVTSIAICARPISRRRASARRSGCRAPRSMRCASRWAASPPSSKSDVSIASMRSSPTRATAAAFRRSHISTAS